MSCARDDEAKIRLFYLKILDVPFSAGFMVLLFEFSDAGNRRGRGVEDPGSSWGGLPNFS